MLLCFATKVFYSRFPKSKFVARRNPAICSTADAGSSWPALILFWAPIQVLESRNGSGEQQNLGQGLRVFKCTIGALTQGQGEFMKMVCRLLKHLKERKIQLISANRAISVLTWLQVPQINKTSRDWHDWEPQNRMRLEYFGKCESADPCSGLCWCKIAGILAAEFSALLAHNCFGLPALWPPLSAPKLLNHSPFNCWTHDLLSLNYLTPDLLCHTASSCLFTSIV